ncbi:hypothetical protein CEK25_003361 [Fusarium fujikuroi]|nr:hypothetical protein CEK25_003361 [Fusarium fujikuroi]
MGFMEVIWHFQGRLVWHLYDSGSGSCRDSIMSLIRRAICDMVMSKKQTVVWVVTCTFVARCLIFDSVMYPKAIPYNLPTATMETVDLITGLCRASRMPSPATHFSPFQPRGTLIAKSNVGVDVTDFFHNPALIIKSNASCRLTKSFIDNLAPNPDYRDSLLTTLHGHLAPNPTIVIATFLAHEFGLYLITVETLVAPSQFEMNDIRVN